MERSIFLLLIILFKSGLCTEDCTARIAVIGGGIGGASASHFVSDLFGEAAKIDVYEAGKLGGRLATVNIDGRDYEAGGSIIHARNRYMRRFADELGLKYANGVEGVTGIWNGDAFVYKTSRWRIISIARLIYRYGLQPFKLNRYINTVLSDFEKVYDLQEGGASFENTTALLAAMNHGFPSMLETTMRTHFVQKGFDKRMIEELMKATVVVNYGQDTDVHSFVGCVSLAAVGSDLWSVKGGNKKVPEQLIERNRNVNLLRNRVTKIVNAKSNGKNTYEVHYTDKDGKESKKTDYDVVILATPLTKDQKFPIAFEGFPEDFQFDGEYHSLTVTFLKADLKPQYFKLDETIDSVLSCEPNKTVVNSVGRLKNVESPSKEDRRVWKIFSNSPLKQEIIDGMFSNVDEKVEVAWKAYPEYSKTVPFGKFKLHDAVFHTNAVEWAASAMEMSAIAGRNAAIMSLDYFKKSNPKCTFRKATRSSAPPLRGVEL